MMLTSVMFRLLVALATILATVAGQPYEPQVPASYQGCLFDPASKSSFNLLGAQGLPIISDNGTFSQATDIVETVDRFHFSGPGTQNGTSGVYDVILMQNGVPMFLAVFQSGGLGVVPASSNGSQLVNPGNATPYVTTVFSLQCNGFMTAGFAGLEQLYFAVGADGTLTAFPALNTTRKRDATILQGFYILPQTPSIQSIAGILEGQRCPSLQQYAVFKNNLSVPIEANGCGTATGIGYYVPELEFHECCDGHDICYSNCTQDWTTCNGAFYDCMLSKCLSLYGHSEPLQHWGCQKSAELYHYAVSTPLGLDAFGAATQEACDCFCDDPTLMACGNDCVDLTTDAGNCGGCNVRCLSGGCLNGACTWTPCVGLNASLTCGTGASCQCVSNTEGVGFCAEEASSCVDMRGCTSNADCPMGSICTIDALCGEVCASSTNCGTS